MALRLAGRVQRDSLRGGPGGGWLDLSSLDQMSGGLGSQKAWCLVNVNVSEYPPKKSKNLRPIFVCEYRLIYVDIVFG